MSPPMGSPAAPFHRAPPPSGYGTSSLDRGPLTTSALRGSGYPAPGRDSLGPDDSPASQRRPRRHPAQSRLAHPPRAPDPDGRPIPDQPGRASPGPQPAMVATPPLGPHRLLPERPLQVVRPRRPLLH